MTSMLRAGGAAAMQGARRSRSGAVPPSGSIAGTVQHGATLTLTGSGYTSLQWLHAGSPISGETASTYTVDRADGVLDHGDITCEMTGPGGVVESNALVYEGADLPLAIFCLDYDVTLVGSDVDSIAASFGSIACTLTAPAATNRPAFTTGGVGGRGLATFDGTDNVLAGAITKGSAWADYEWGFVGQRLSFSTLGDEMIGYYNGATLRFSLNDQDANRCRVTVAGGANVASVSFDPDTAPAHVSGNGSSGTVSLLVAGSVNNSAAGTITSRADGGTCSLGATPTGTTACHQAIQAPYMGAALTADQRTDLRSLLTGLTGVAS